MKLEIKDTQFKTVGQVDASDKVFNAEMNADVVYEAVRNQLSKRRQGTASTKTRGEVSGTTSKPWKQKGTGRARSGNNRSPLWKRGGAVFGPHPRDYGARLPKKVRRNALFSIISSLVKNNKLIVVEDYVQKTHKTKEIAAIFSKISKKNHVAFIVNAKDKENTEKIKRSGRNLPWLNIFECRSVELSDLLKAEEVFMSKSTVEELGRIYG